MNKRGKPSINLEFIFHKTIKILAWFGSGLVLLLTLLWMVIQIPATQTFLAQKAVSFIEDKINTKFEVKGIDIDLPQSLVLNDIYLEDLAGDTLVYSERLVLNLGLFNLISKEVLIEELKLFNLVGSINRQKSDSLFNYQFIIDAFATDSPSQADTVSAGWQIDLEQVEIKKARFAYEDKLQAQFFGINIGDCSIGMDQFDIDSMTFLAEKFQLADSRISYDARSGNDKSAQKTEIQSQKTDLKFNIRTTVVKNTDVTFTDEIQHLDLSANIGHLFIKSDNLDISRQKIALQGFQLDNSFITFSHTQSQDTNSGTNISEMPKENTGYPANQDWSFSLSQLTLSNNNFGYNNNYAGDTLTSFTDLNHIALTTEALKVQDIKYSKNLLSATISKAILSEARGINIGEFQSRINISDQGTRIDLSHLHFNNSKVALNFSTDINALAANTSEIGEAQIVLDIDHASVALQDIGLFQPTLLNSLTFLKRKDFSVFVQGAISGKINDLKIDQLDLRVGDTTKLSMAGGLTGLPDIDSTYYRLTVNRLTSSEADLSKLVAEQMWPQSLCWPESIVVSGNVLGSFKDFEGQLKADLYEGKFSSEFTVRNENSENKTTFNGKYAFEQLDVGALLNDRKFYGSITMNGEIEGSKASSGELLAELSTSIDSVNINNYTYKKVKIDSRLSNKVLQTSVESKDPNLLFDLENSINFSNSLHVYSIELALEKADLQETYWVSDEIIVRGNLASEIAFSSLGNLDGDFDLRKVEIIKNGKLYKIDSLLFLSINQTGKSELNIESDVMYADFKGNFDITTLPDALMRFINAYYPTAEMVDMNATELQKFDFEIDIRNSDVLTEILFPRLKNFEPAEIIGNFDNQQKDLGLTVDIPSMNYNGFNIDSLVFTLASEGNKLSYQFDVGHAESDRMEINHFSIYGNVQNDSIDVHLAILDTIGNKRWFVEASMEREEQDNIIKVFPESFMLNYEKWGVSGDNEIKISKGRVYDSKLLISKDEQTIKIESDYNEKDNSFVTLGLSQLNLADLSKIVDHERAVVTGILNAHLNLEGASSSVNYDSEMLITNFGVLGDTVGDLSLTAHNKGNERHFLDLGIQHSTNRVKVSGFLEMLEETTVLHMNADIAKLDLSSVEAFAFGTLEDTEGALHGNLQVDGTAAEPVIDGILHFDDVKFKVDYVNSVFGIKDESITLSENKILFDQFEITDDDHDKAVIDGYLFTKNYVDYNYNLNVEATRFKLLNTQSKDNDLYYGKLYVDARIELSGTTGQPNIDMDLTVVDGTDLTYMVPQTEVGIIRRKGLVEFIDQDTNSDRFYEELYKNATQDTLEAELTGINLTANIDINDKSLVRVIVDPVSGDFLSLSGNANLSLGIVPSGDISLSGRYEVQEGHYKLSFYKLVKREFDLEEGSYVIWTGDPYNPRLNITAIYTTEASTYELIANQVIGAEANQLKQQVPVEVHMNMHGLLMSPEINFRFDMPSEERQVLGGAPYAKLLSLNNDESSLNKQVFALLTLKKFIADDPLSDGGNAVEAQARNSVSKILTNELNKLTSGVEVVDISLNVDSYEDYSSGSAEGRTALELGISKQFLDDRVVVKVAGNFDLEGNEDNPNNISNYIGDLLIEYKLTEDDRFRLTGFRRSQYESILNQEVVGTGVGIIFVRDYNAFRELFESKKLPQ